MGDKRPSFDLKGELKKLIFPASREHVVVSEDAGTFTMVISTFTQYEKYVSGVKIFMPSLVPSPCPAFYRFQYGEAGEGLLFFLM